MNVSLTILELAVVSLGIAILLVDLWLPEQHRRLLGYTAAAGVGLILVASFLISVPSAEYAFGKMYVMDPLALFFKRFFLLAGAIVLLLSVEFSDRIETGIGEYYTIILFALSGMMFAASANDLILVFVALELITVAFYVLTSFQRNNIKSLEAGVKYLILGALASAFMVYGIALIFGTANSTKFGDILAVAGSVSSNPLFLLGILFVLVGLGFKIAAFPFQMWAPDVYQGSPTPTTALLAVGSKAAGIVLLLRILFSAVPQIASQWTSLLIVISGVTILYGNLCALPQRSLKRLLGYSSIAHAGYLLLGIAAVSMAGSSAILYYLLGYLFTVLAAFTVICIVMREVDNDDISSFEGLHARSPLLAATLSLAMISLAGIPPLAGFFGKFLLLKAVIEQGANEPGYYCLVIVALVGVVISLYYYLGVVRTVYWTNPSPGQASILVSTPVRFMIYACIVGMLYLGLLPNAAVNLAIRAVQVFHL